MRLKQASHELFLQIENLRNGIVEPVDGKNPQGILSNADLSPLLQVMKDAQLLVQKNEKSLQLWLDQMKSDVQHHRQSHATRGVLATYVQQRQGISSQALNLDDSLLLAESRLENAVPPPSSSPWVVPGKSLDTMGHQVNHQS